MKRRMWREASRMRVTMAPPSAGSTGPSKNASSRASAQPSTIESGLIRSWATTPANDARLSRSWRARVTSR